MVQLVNNQVRIMIIKGVKETFPPWSYVSCNFVSMSNVCLAVFARSRVRRTMSIPSKTLTFCFL